jgi:hypothetical protein
MCNRNNWFKKRSHKITRYNWDGSVGTVIDYFILIRNIWNILNDVKAIPSISLEGDHRILIAEFRKVAE